MDPAKVMSYTHRRTSAGLFRGLKGKRRRTERRLDEQYIFQEKKYTSLSARALAGDDWSLTGYRKTGKKPDQK